MKVRIRTETGTFFANVIIHAVRLLRSVSEEHPDDNRRDTSSDTGPVPDKGKLSRESSGSEKSEKQFLDGTEQQNENNNNPSRSAHKTQELILKQIGTTACFVFL